MPREHWCDQCDAKFPTAWQLVDHKRAIHIREKTYKCDHCDYAASTQSCLNNHKRVKHSH